MNGHISVSSTPGVGSESWWNSPCSPFRTIRRNRMFPSKTSGYWLWTTILSHVSTSTLILNRIGVDAEYVTSGKAAVTRVKSALQRHTCYNIALVDWKMPDMDGVETAAPSAASWGPIRW